MPGPDSGPAPGHSASLQVSLHSLGNVKGAGHKVPAGIRGKVFFRDKGLCQFKDTSGNACNEKRFIELHHIKPRSLGGPNTLENLTSLCSAHHKLIHFRADGP